MTTVKIDFRTGASSEATRTRVAADLQGVLASLRIEPTSAHATFADENGPKGGVAIRCALEVRTPRRPIVHVADMARTPRLAFGAALAKLERALAREREVTRQSRRRPKKYFAARHALAS